MGNEPAKQVSAGLTPLFLSTILFWMLATNCAWSVVLFSDRLTQCSITRPGETSFTKWCYTSTISTVIIAANAEEETDSPFCKTCQAMEGQKSFMKPTMLHAAMSAETCFAALLCISFS